MYETKMGGRCALRARPPIFGCTFFLTLLIFVGFGPIFDQFFWDFILKNKSKYKEKARIIVIIVVVIIIVIIVKYIKRPTDNRPTDNR